MKKTIIIIIGIAIIGGGGFYAGIRYDQNKVASDRQARQQQFGGTVGRGARGGGGNFGAANIGEILSKDDKSITLKLRDGGSKIVFLSETTQVMKSTEGSIKDLSVGGQVTISGNANTDGSVNAQSIQIRPNLQNNTNNK